MRREKALNVFLFFVVQALLFVCFFPIYFSFDKIHVRTVSMPERMFSLLFVVLWLLLCVYCAWKKRRYLLAGGVLYSIMAYLPGWFLPSLAAASGSAKEQGLMAGILESFFEKMYELVNAPLAGVSLLVSEKASTSLSRWLLPFLLLSYVGTHLFRFYRNAYLAEQLHLEDNAYYSNPTLARELAAAPGSVYSRGAQETAAPAVQPDEQLPQKTPDILPDNAPDDNEQTRMHFPVLPE